MSILRDGVRAQVGEELLKHKQEIARSASNIIQDVIIRKARFNELRDQMTNDTENFSASDIAEMDAIEAELLVRIQEVYNLVSG